MIVKYSGQPIAPGMIVCRQGVMTNGFASQPVIIVSVSKSRATVRDLHDETEKRISLHTIAFIVDTMAEGVKLARASLEYLTREMEVSKEQASARSARMREAVERAISGVSP